MRIPKVGMHQGRETNPKLVSMEVIYNLTGKLEQLTKESVVPLEETGTKKPYPFALTFLPDLIVYTKFDFYEFGKTYKREKRPDFIYYAKRDGQTEYEMFDKKLEFLKERMNNPERLQRLREKNRVKHETLKEIRDEYLVPYEERCPVKKPFESRLIDLGYATINNHLKNQYLVLEMETNGFRPGSDDILSLSVPFQMM